jgi:hypothetical protein
MRRRLQPLPASGSVGPKPTKDPLACGRGAKKHDAVQQGVVRLAERSAYLHNQWVAHSGEAARLVQSAEIDQAGRCLQAGEQYRAAARRDDLCGGGSLSQGLAGWWHGLLPRGRSRLSVFGVLA